MRWAVLVLVCFLFAGCFEEAKITPPPPKVYFKPSVFSKGKIVINPYRDPRTFGPESPYRLEFDEDSGVYRIVLKKGVLAPPPPKWTHGLIYE